MGGGGALGVTVGMWLPKKYRVALVTFHTSITVMQSYHSVHNKLFLFVKREHGKQQSLF